MQWSVRKSVRRATKVETAELKALTFFGERKIAQMRRAGPEGCRIEYEVLRFGHNFGWSDAAPNVEDDAQGSGFSCLGLEGSDVLQCALLHARGWKR